MMKAMSLFVLFLAVPWMVWSDGETDALSIYEYVKLYPSNSAELSAALDKADEAEAALETAQSAQQSSYQLGLLESERVYRGAQIRVTENALVREAMQTLFALYSAEADVGAAERAAEIAATEYSRTRAFLTREDVSVRDGLIARISALQAVADTRGPKDTLRDTRNTLMRSIGRWPGGAAVVMAD